MSLQDAAVQRTRQATQGCLTSWTRQAQPPLPGRELGLADILGWTGSTWITGHRDLHPGLQLRSCEQSVLPLPVDQRDPGSRSFDRSLRSSCLPGSHLPTPTRPCYAQRGRLWGQATEFLWAVSVSQGQAALGVTRLYSKQLTVWPAQPHLNHFLCLASVTSAFAFLSFPKGSLFELLSRWRAGSQTCQENT